MNIKTWTRRKNILAYFLEKKPAQTLPNVKGNETNGLNICFHSSSIDISYVTVEPEISSSNRKAGWWTESFNFFCHALEHNIEKETNKQRTSLLSYASHFLMLLSGDSNETGFHDCQRFGIAKTCTIVCIVEI